MYIHSACLLLIGYLIGGISMFFGLRFDREDIRLHEFVMYIFIGPLMVIMLPIIKTIFWIKEDW